MSSPAFLKKLLPSTWSKLFYSTVIGLSLLNIFFWGSPWTPQGNNSALQQQSQVPWHIDEVKTDNFIASLHLEDFERNGSDYMNPYYSPMRLGVPLEKLKKGKDYDFQRLDEVMKNLKGVDRRKVLKHIFKEVTKGSTTNSERHLALLRFLHKSSFHNYLIPVYRNAQAIRDPLVLLRLSEMWCGDVATLAIDLFQASGYQGRMVQLGAHQIAEVFYDEDWHYIDGDAFANGETVYDPDGTIPSVVELSKEPFRIDRLAHFQEFGFGGWLKVDSVRYPSWYYFAQGAYGPTLSQGMPVHYVKTANQEEEKNQYYGWNYQFTQKDEQRTLYDMKPFYQPGAVTFSNIKVLSDAQKGGKVELTWSEALDEDHDLLGYKVFVSLVSRGWVYGRFEGPSHLKPFINIAEGWKPSMYEKKFQIPPHEVAMVFTKQPSVILMLPSNDKFFISVMPLDAHGESVGKVLYFLSHEITVDLSLKENTRI